MRRISLPSSSFKNQGSAVFPSIVSQADGDRRVAVLGIDVETRTGSRRLLRSPLFSEAAWAIAQHPRIRVLLAEHSQAVQCTLFAKGPTSNWSITPQQDLSISVRERLDVEGWRGWSEKKGLIFVQPPASVLEQLVAVHLQLDTQSSKTGPLEVIPRTRLFGRRSGAEILQHGSTHKHRCLVDCGGALVMRPLIIHPSSKSETSLPRRVLHFLFGPPLPSGMH